MKFLDNPANKLEIYYNGTILRNKKTGQLALVVSVSGDSETCEFSLSYLPNQDIKHYKKKELRENWEELPKKQFYLNTGFCAALVSIGAYKDYKKSLSCCNLVIDDYRELSVLSDTGEKVWKNGYTRNFLHKTAPTLHSELYLAQYKGKRCKLSDIVDHHYGFFNLIASDIDMKRNRRNMINRLLAGFIASYSPDGAIKFEYETPGGGRIICKTPTARLGYYDQDAHCFVAYSENIPTQMLKRVKRYLRNPEVMYANS